MTKPHSSKLTTVATLALIIAIAGLIVGAVAWRNQHNSERDARMREQKARIASCEASNGSRYGGTDYLRPVIRALVNEHYSDVVAAIEAEGLKSRLAHVSDIPQINCKTGNPLPLPKGAIP